MSYNYIKERVRSSLHTGIDYVIPSHPLIGAVSGGVGYYTRLYTLTYSQASLVSIVQGQSKAFASTLFSLTPTFLENAFGFQSWSSSIGNFCGYFIAPFIVPETSSYMAERLPIISALTTSFTLNIIAQQFFGIPIKKEGKNVEHLIQSLKDMGVEIPLNSLNQKNKQACLSESIPSPFKDIVFPQEYLNCIESKLISTSIPPVSTVSSTNQSTLPKNQEPTKKLSDNLFEVI